jgi:hypothetical protein
MAVLFEFIATPAYHIVLLLDEMRSVPLEIGIEEVLHKRPGHGREKGG